MKGEKKRHIWYVFLFNKIGLLYYEGDGVEKDLSKALEYFKKAADQGHEDAQIYLNKNSKVRKIIKK